MYSTWTSEMNDSNTVRDKREELGILCDKGLALYVEQYNVI